MTSSALSTRSGHGNSLHGTEPKGGTVRPRRINRRLPILPGKGPDMSNLMTGANILVECLLREGVDCLFGYPGGVTLPFYDVLYDAKVRHYLVRHEENACFAAQGYARSTGKVGVCCATSGPGATNLVTGLVDALLDSIPIVAITGQVSTKLIGSDAFQEADTFGITRSCTKHNFLVKSVDDLPRAIHEAFYIAASGRHGDRALRAGRHDPPAGV
jgi:acetolactate synthase-1/2/3 large subunit